MAHVYRAVACCSREPCLSIVVFHFKCIIEPYSMLVDYSEFCWKGLLAGARHPVDIIAVHIDDLIAYSGRKKYYEDGSGCESCPNGQKKAHDANFSTCLFF